MNRRTFLTSTAATGSVIAISGCLGILGGGGDGNDDGYAGEPVDPNEDDETGSGHRVDFVDEAGTLGQIAKNYSSEEEYDKIVNQYSEDDWQTMDDNDLQVAENTLSDNDSSVEEIRPHVEQEIQNSPESEPNERALMRGIGLGINDDTLISGSVDAANVLKPLAEEFASEYIDTGAFQAWIIPAVMPATEGRYAHLPLTVAYEHDGGFRRDYVEDGVPDAPGLGENATAIRSPEMSVYFNSDEREMVTGHEYRKAFEMARNGQIEQEGRVHPIRAISTGLLSSMRNIVDSAFNDSFSTEEIPPHGLVTHVSQAFGESVEDAFYDLTEQRLQHMENVGRGVQLFYEEHGGRSNLAVGGSLTAPEFYIFPDSNKETAWNFEYDDISELVA